MSSENSALPGIPLPTPGRRLRNEMMKEGWSGKKMLSGNNGRFGEETLSQERVSLYSTNAHHTFRYQPFVRHNLSLSFFFFFSDYLMFTYSICKHQRKIYMFESH